MTDRLGYRRKFGVIAPSTNTIVQPEFDSMRVPGVTSHYGRILIRDGRIGDDEGMEALLEQIRASMADCVEGIMTMEPDYMVMGMSAETFWDGVEGNRQFVQQIKDLSGGLGVATGAEACERALHLFGAKKIAVVTPYTPIGDANVRKFFTELGFEVGADQGPQLPDAPCRSRTSASRRCARRSSRSTTRRRRDRPVRHQPLHVRARRRGRALARQAGHRDQRRHLVDGAARQRHRGQGPRLRLPAARALSRLRRLRSVYAALWRLLPGPTWLKVIEALALIGLAFWVLLAWVFPADRAAAAVRPDHRRRLIGSAGGGSDSARAVERLADDVGVTGMARGLFDHVEQHVSHVAVDQVRTRAGTVQVHRGCDRSRLCDLLPVVRDPVIHGVGLVDDQVGVSGLGRDGGPTVGELASGHHDLEPASLPGRGMLHQP